MYQQPHYPQQPPNTYYPPEQWPQPPKPSPSFMHPQREIRMEVKIAALVCFAVALIFAALGIPFLTLVAGLALLTGIVLVFLI